MWYMTMRRMASHASPPSVTPKSRSGRSGAGRRRRMGRDGERGTLIKPQVPLLYLLLLPKQLQELLICVGERHPGTQRSVWRI